jgi:HK97 family phage prohead protease
MLNLRVLEKSREENLPLFAHIGFLPCVEKAAGNTQWSPGEPLFIEGVGYYSLEKDRHDETIYASAFDKAMPEYMKNPILLYCHNKTQPVGVVVEWRADPVGVFIRARVDATEEWLIRKILDQTIRAFSVGFLPLRWSYNEEMDVWEHLEIDVLEFSVVTIPSSKKALFSIAKAFEFGTDIVIPDANFNFNVNTKEHLPIITEFPNIEAVLFSLEKFFVQMERGDFVLSDNARKHLKKVGESMQPFLGLKPAGKCEKCMELERFCDLVVKINNQYSEERQKKINY